MDFVTGLPECDGYDAIWIAVDKFSKMRHFVLCKTTVDARELAKMFLREVVRIYRLPKTIESDRVPQDLAIL